MAKEKKSTALAVAKPKALATSAPAHIKTSGRGKEALKAGDFTLPFLRLAIEKTPGVITEELEEGQFFNSTSNEQYGESVEVIVINAITGQMRWGDYKKKEGILCQSPDGETALAMNGKTDKGKPTNKCGECALAQWHGKTPPECNKQGRFLVMRPGDTQPMIFILQSTNFNLTRKLNTMLAGDHDLFAHVVKLSYTMADGVHKFSASRVGWASEKDYAVAERLYESTKRIFLGGALSGIGAAD